jgi:hypothetical protein
MSVIEECGDVGIRVQSARMAVLLERDVLRPHVDEHRARRFLFALNKQGTDFRHVFDRLCFCLQVGQLWEVDGTVCHGAANIALSGARVAMVVDAQVGHGSFVESWEIPSDQLIERPPLTEEVRHEVDRLASWHSASGRYEEAERVWLFLPFEYDIPAAAVYAELVEFATRNIERCNLSEERLYWFRRRDYLRAPRLRFEVAAPQGGRSA